MRRAINCYLIISVDAQREEQKRRRYELEGSFFRLRFVTVVQGESLLGYRLLCLKKGMDTRSNGSVEPVNSSLVTKEELGRPFLVSALLLRSERSQQGKRKRKVHDLNYFRLKRY